MRLPLNQKKIRQVRPEVIIYDGENRFDVSRYVRAIYTDVAIDSPIGTMRITFVPVNNENLQYSINQVMNLLMSKIRVYCRISVKIDRQEQEHTFYGLIDHVIEQKTTLNGSTQRTLVCNCSMMLPKLLGRDEIPASDILQSDPRVKKELGELRTQFFALMRGSDIEGRKSVFQNATPDKPIKYILENAPATQYFKKYMNFSQDDKESLFNQKNIYGENLIDLNFLKTDIIFSETLGLYSGSVLGYIMACMDPYFYEIFFETTTLSDGTPANKMTIRPRPFSYRDMDSEERVKDGWTYWEDLTAIDFHSRYRLSEQLGVNDFEITNFFETVYDKSLILSPETQMGGLLGSQFPSLDFDLIKKYGLRPHRSRVEYLNTLEIEGNEQGNKTFKTDETDKFFSSLLTKRDKQADWFLYPAYESGQMTVLGNSAYKIGRKLFYTDRVFYDFDKVFQEAEPVKGMEFYIARVGHTFEYPETYTTTLGLTRGQPVNVENKVGEYTKSSVIDWLKRRNLLRHI